MTLEQFQQQQAAMSDLELIQRVKKLISDLAGSGGSCHKMTVPPEVTDSDMLLSELVRRFELYCCNGRNLVQLIGAPAYEAENGNAVVVTMPISAPNPDNNYYLVPGSILRYQYYLAAGSPPSCVQHSHCDGVFNDQCPDNVSCPIHKVFRCRVSAQPTINVSCITENQPIGLSVQEPNHGNCAKYNGDDWISIEDRNNPIPKEGKIEIKFKKGTILDFDAKDWPWDEVTHWRLKSQPINANPV